MSEFNTTENVNNNINFRIKYLIESILGITPYEFSKQLGKKRSDWLYKIIKNEVSPSPKTLEQIFSLYPKHKVWLLTGENTLVENVISKREEKIDNSFSELKIDDKLNELYKMISNKGSLKNENPDTLSVTGESLIEKIESIEAMIETNSSIIVKGQELQEKDYKILLKKIQKQDEEIKEVKKMISLLLDRIPV